MFERHICQHKVCVLVKKFNAHHDICFPQPTPDWVHLGAPPHGLFFVMWVFH